MSEHLEGEDRVEPRIEVVPEDHQGHPELKKTDLAKPKKRWIWFGGCLAIVVILGVLVWALWQPGPVVNPEAQEAGQLQTIKGQVQKLEQDWSQFRKEMDALRGEQKVLSDQFKALKDRLAAIQARTEKSPEKKEAPRAISYKVKKGDTLQTIAIRFQVRPEDIRKWNRLGAQGDLKPGKMLTLYPPS